MNRRHSTRGPQLLHGMDFTALTSAYQATVQIAIHLITHGLYVKFFFNVRAGRVLSAGAELPGEPGQGSVHSRHGGRGEGSDAAVPRHALRCRQQRREAGVIPALRLKVATLWPLALHVYRHRAKRQPKCRLHCDIITFCQQITTLYR